MPRFRFLVLLTSGLFAASIPLSASFPIVMNGKPVAALASAGPPSKSVNFAGMQLQLYVKKMTGAVLPRGSAPYRIYIGLVDQPGMKLPPKAVELAGTIRDDGFLLYTDKERKALYIAAKEPRGVNFGVFDLLRTYGGIRWIFPGKDGEFIPKKKDFVLPDLAVVKNPAFRYRRFNLVSAYGAGGTWLWMLRNGMSASGEFYGEEKSYGGHIFSHLLPDTYFKEKPELYCYYNGKRHPQCGSPEQIANSPVGGQANQPCTSNPETVRIMCESVAEILRKQPDIAVFNICNNDSTTWCECENCKKLDPPEEAARGIVSTRYWLLVNQLIEAGKKVSPHVRFRAAAYQTFQEYPLGVTPHPDAEIELCPHHRCYLHSIGDPKCKVNERYRKIMNAWSGAGHKISTYEYTDILPRGDVWYLPIPRLLAQDLKWYAERRHNGWCDEVAPFDGTYVDHSRLTKERWIGNALDLYLTAALTWNPDLDIDAYEEDAGSIYYSKAWPAMKQYRKNLWLAYKGICDHFCYGSPLVRLGRACEAPGLEQSLKSLLEQALKDAAGDKRVETAVKRDAEFYALTFEKSYVLYRETLKSCDVRAAELSSDDPDWDLADWAYAGNLPVKLAYKDDILYIKVFPHEPMEKDSELEVFLAEKTERFPLEKGPVFQIRLPRPAVPGESVNVGIVFHSGQEKISWNGGAPNVPEALRSVSFGMVPLLQNGSFETVVKKDDGRIVPAGFSIKGGQKCVYDGSAAAGRVFLRGGGFMFQYLNGLLGLNQTYGTPDIFTGKLLVRIKFRGQGRAAVRLTNSDLGVIGEQSREISSADWQETVFEFDCSNDGGKLLLLYVFSFSGELDMDDIRLEKKIK